MLRGKESYNDQMIRLATTEAFIDLIVNGSMKGGKTFEQRSIDQLDAIYGPEKDVDYKKVVSFGNLYNR